MNRICERCGNLVDHLYWSPNGGFGSCQMVCVRCVYKAREQGGQAFAGFYKTTA